MAQHKPRELPDMGAASRHIWPETARPVPRRFPLMVPHVPECKGGSNGGRKSTDAPKTQRKHNLARGEWRRRRDSNPRDGFPSAPLAGVCLRPLGHVSADPYREIAGGEQVLSGGLFTPDRKPSGLACAVRRRVQGSAGRDAQAVQIGTKPVRRDRRRRSCVAATRILRMMTAGDVP